MAEECITRTAAGYMLILKRTLYCQHHPVFFTGHLACFIGVIISISDIKSEFILPPKTIEKGCRS